MASNDFSFFFKPKRNPVALELHCGEILSIETLLGLMWLLALVLVVVIVGVDVAVVSIVVVIIVAVVVDLIVAVVVFAASEETLLNN